MPRYTPITLRISEQIQEDPTAGCWEWQGATTRGGYAHIRRPFHGAHVRVARLIMGEPAGLCVCHRCDNPLCVNPAHLFVASQADNMADASRKGRLRGNPGQREDKTAFAHRREIRRRYAKGNILQRQLAEEFGVSQVRISQIIHER